MPKTLATHLKWKKNDENLFEYEKTIKGLLYLIEEYEEKQINIEISHKWNVEVQNILDYDEMISNEYDKKFHKIKMLIGKIKIWTCIKYNINVQNWI